LLAHGQWFSPGTSASSTTKTGRHDIAEILLKAALNTINQIKSNQIPSNSWQLSAHIVTKETVFPTFLHRKSDYTIFPKCQCFKMDAFSVNLKIKLMKKLLYSSRFAAVYMP
jgi:hypothetical protein